MSRERAQIECTHLFYDIIWPRSDDPEPTDALKALVTDALQDLITEAKAEARREALEEAAKVAWRYACGAPSSELGLSRQRNATQIAQEIEALKG